jgi:hypothetical protein
VCEKPPPIPHTPERPDRMTDDSGARLVDCDESRRGGTWYHRDCSGWGVLTAVLRCGGGSAIRVRRRDKDVG